MDHSHEDEAVSAHSPWLVSPPIRAADTSAPEPHQIATETDRFFQSPVTEKIEENIHPEYPPSTNGSSEQDSLHKPHTSEDQQSTVRTTNLTQWRPKPSMWNPLWLKTSVLIAFAMVFAMMALAVILLYHYSKVNNGLGSQIETRHYLWTYGPTAVLIIVYSLWEKVDYATRSLIPWREMRHRDSPADRSIFLDYISPFRPVFLYRALKNGHGVVLMTGLACFLIKLTTVFSTGLIVLAPAPMNMTDFPYSVQSTFNATGIQLSDFAQSGYLAPQRYYGIASGGLQYPNNTGRNVIVQAFEPVFDPPSYANLSVELDGFQSEFDCEELNLNPKDAYVSFMPDRSLVGSLYAINITTPTCNVSDVYIGAPSYHGYMANPNVTENYQGNIANITCNDGIPANAYHGDRPDHSLTWPDQRIILSVVRLAWLHATPSMGSQYAYKNVTVTNLTALMCKPTYTFGRYNVTYAAASNFSNPPITATLMDGKNASLPGFNTSMLTASIPKIFDYTKVGTGGPDYVFDFPVSPFFQYMSGINDDSRQQAFMDPTVLKNVASELWIGTSIQMVRQFLMEPSSKVIVGGITTIEERLQVKGLSAGFMIAFLLLLSLTSVLLLFLRPKDVAPIDPTTIVASAAILSASPAFCGVLASASSPTEGSSLMSPQQQSYRTDSSFDRFHLHASRTMEPQVSTSDDNAESSAWWKPMASQSWFLITAIWFTLTVFIVLFILQHESDAHQGFIGLATVSSTSHLLASYIPAAIMLGIAAFVSSTELTSAILAPFQRLKKGNAPLLVLTNPLVGRLPPHALITAIRTRSIQHVLLILASLVAATLTIVVSGLYTIATVSTLHTSGFQQQDRFDFLQASQISLDDNNAASISSLVEFNNLSFPTWTYDDLAFNQVSLEGANSANNGTANLQVPAYRATLNCSAIPSSSHSTSYKHDVTMGIKAEQPSYQNQIAGGVLVGTQALHGHDIYNQDVNVTARFANPCMNLVSNNTDMQWHQSFALPTELGSFWLGQSTLVQWQNGNPQGDGSAIKTGVGTNLISTLASTYDTGQHGCPTWGMTLGNVTRYLVQNQTFLDASWQTVICYQQVEKVQVNLTLSTLDMSIDTTKPPVVNESSAQKLTSPLTNTEIWEFPIQTFIENFATQQTASLYGLDALPAPNGSVSSTNNFDSFIQAMIDGRDPTPINELFTNSDKFIASGTRIYSRYMAQLFSNNMRNSTTVPQNRYSAQLTDVNVLRLKQNRGPAIALEVMLAMIAVVLLIVLLLRDMRNVVPRNPCSIAGIASLLAGSRLASREVMPEGSEVLSAKQLERAGVFSGLRFRSGWQGSSGVEGKVPFLIDLDEEDR
ncbi:hypothetical protein K461DRAFT_313355 [Myriangium duriaei CBS 260.36]|uniref:Uncharacterized protein n=1 Tax=Myriangium duriaei CBS 260.36 TaxID=1168546 RepID=A0A9P4J254_9PEZI|nr:hypothetical protein K461DRAFT_313355 [Myriangium duriaei CBS 260.36]